VSQQPNPKHSSSSSSSTTTLYGVVASLIAGAAVTAANHTDETRTGISECSGASSSDSDAAKDTATKVAMGKLRSQFACPVIVLNNLANRMTAEMNKGLISTKGAQIKMLPSFVNRLPTGEESGEFLALDLGGSNFRVCTFRLVAGQGVNLGVAHEVTIPASLMTSESTAEDLFGFIADQVGKAPGARDTSTPDLNLGFTFSFPVDQKSIDSGILLHWTKGFATRGCVGEEIVSLLQKELRSRGISVQVSALVNDTVGTLVANILDDSDTHVGVILGTGCNACYTEKASNIVKMASTSGSLDEEMVSILL
jgi:hexokinase